jgi:hypothetical protein
LEPALKARLPRPAKLGWSAVSTNPKEDVSSVFTKRLPPKSTTSLLDRVMERADERSPAEANRGTF